jgi:hypothetical protein
MSLQNPTAVLIGTLAAPIELGAASVMLREKQALEEERQT